MIEFEKYKFDDFVVKSEDESFDDFGISKGFLNDTSDKTLDENVDLEETSEDIEVEEEKIVEETISLVEMEKKIAEASKQAYEEGVNSIRCDIEDKVSQSLETIENELKDIYGVIDEKTKNIEKDYLFLMKEALKKIVPTILEKDAEKIVANFVKENFKVAKNESKLHFYVNSEIFKSIKDKIDEIAKKNDFEGKYFLTVDDNLLPSDCRIEWEHGGVERITNKIVERIEKI